MLVTNDVTRSWRLKLAHCLCQLVGVRDMGTHKGAADTVQNEIFGALEYLWRDAIRLQFMDPLAEF